MAYLEIIALIISFLVVYTVTPWFIKYLKSINLTVKDQNKKDKPLVPISGGLAVLTGFIIATFVYIFLRLFAFKTGLFGVESNEILQLFAGILSILMITVIGFLDDIVIPSHKNESAGFKQWQKPILTLIAAIPLMAVSAGVHSISLPFIGTLELGLIYPLVLIPIGVVGAANMVNLLAGFNGLETGMGIIYTGMLGIYAYVNGSYIASVVSLIMCAALIAFWMYNKTPAKILPGDSLTYLLGGTLAVIAIIGNIEKAALICSIPFFIEFALKTKGKYKVNTYGYEKNGKIQNIYGKKVFSLPHLMTRTGKYTEKQITWTFILLELVFALLIWII